MSQGTEPQLSQTSLAPPVELSGPATPVQRPSLSPSPELSVKVDNQVSPSEKSKLRSPPSLTSSDMTPPPSTQVPGAPLRRSRSRSRSRTNSYLASPPDIEKTLCVAYGASENLPTADDIDAADNSKVRTIAKELLGVAQEARMSALHFKLQNSLLSFTSNEAIKRAEVEHQLARREVEILQSSEYRSRNTEVKPLQQISNIELELAFKKNQDLLKDNATLDRRLRRAKKLIEQERERSDQLLEENGLLKKRIRDNREHFSLMIEHRSLSPSPHQTPHRPSAPHFTNSASQHVMRHENHNNPFAALLAADRVLNRESPSVTSTPNQHFSQRQRASGHARSTHSMSSFPVTPSQVHQANQYFTPGKDSLDEQRDRDSTISASDIEEAETEEDIPVSQTRSVATSMLRHNPRNQPEARNTVNPPKSSTLLQTKLFGRVAKAGIERPSSDLKRKASVDGATSKKSKSEGVGLGIGTWNNNSTLA